MKQTIYSPWLYRIAIITAGATFLLIVIGGIVTSTESGLAVPDWPTTFGYNMFLYPISEMVGGILYEHSHRLMGSLVGLLTIALFIMILIKDSRKWLKWLGFAALIGVSVQGVLGGLRVTELNLNFAIIHACLAQAFLSLLCGICLFTSQAWHSIEPEVQTDEILSKKLRRLSLITTCLIYVQLIFGAVLRHTGNRLDAHLLLAFLVTLHIILLVRRVFSTDVQTQEIGQTFPLLLLGLLAIQLMLGTGAYITRLTAFGETVSALLTDLVTTGHVAIGALMLAISFVITLKIFRLTDTSRMIKIPDTNTPVIDRD